MSVTKSTGNSAESTVRTSSALTVRSSAATHSSTGGIYSHRLTPSFARRMLCGLTGTVWRSHRLRPSMDTAAMLGTETEPSSPMMSIHSGRT